MPHGNRQDYINVCTVVILRRPGHDWPLIFAANRDEMTDRPWLAPGRHWPDRAEVVAGRDDLAGGTWLGLNDWGVVAGVLNRPGSLGSDPSLRSRGELPLEALEHAEATVAATAMAAIEQTSYRSFNLVIADSAQAFWIKSEGGAGRGGWGGGRTAVSAAALPEGVSMITAHDLNDIASPRIRRFLPKFKTAAEPDPETGDWAAWQSLMGETDGAGEAGEGGPNSDENNNRGAMTITRDVTGPGGGFATVSSSLIALPAAGRPGVRPKWLFAPGRPDQTPYEAVTF